MKRIITNLLCIIAILSAAAAQVSPEQAQATAAYILGSADGTTTHTASVAIPTYTPTNPEGAEYYIFGGSNGRGFVIVSGDDELPAIVGYSHTNPFDPDMMPDGVKAFLKDYSALVDAVRHGSVDIPQPCGGSAIGPLMSVEWDQDAPYNNKCPRMGLQRAPTGCVATAMAQVMKYHAHPANGYGTVTWEKQEFDLSLSNYDWDLMPDRYVKGQYTTAQANQVAQLMVDCGHAVQMEYGSESSGALTEYVAPALVRNFGYDGGIQYQMRSGWSDDAWLRLIRDNLEQGLPMIYGGNGDAGGHQFVCDGIDSNDLLHINWGWSGISDGYYDMNLLSPGDVGIGGDGLTFNEGQDIICYIKPADPGSNTADAWQPHLALCAMNISTPVNASGRYITASDTDPLINVKFEIDNATGGPVKFKYGYIICDAAGTEVARAINYSGSFRDAGYYTPETTVAVSAKDLAQGKYHVMWRWQLNSTGASTDLREFWAGDIAEGFWFEVRADGCYQAKAEPAGTEPIPVSPQWAVSSSSYGHLIVSGAPEGSSINALTIQGITVANATATDAATDIDLSHAPAGVYIIHVTAPDGRRQVFKTILR